MSRSRCCPLCSRSFAGHQSVPTRSVTTAATIRQLLAALLFASFGAAPCAAFSIMTDGTVKIKAVTADQPEMSGCFAVRRKVFIEEQNVPAEIEMDANDDAATHILATQEGTAVGAARIVLTDGGTVGKIGRVCVVPTHRGSGIGRRIVLFAVEELKRTIGRGGKAKLGAQVHAIRFYESMGFELIPGEEYMDAGSVPHRDLEMIL